MLRYDLQVTSPRYPNGVRAGLCTAGDKEGVLSRAALKSPVAFLNQVVLFDPVDDEIGTPRDGARGTLFSAHGQGGLIFLRNNYLAEVPG